MDNARFGLNGDQATNFHQSAWSWCSNFRMHKACFFISWVMQQKWRDTIIVQGAIISSLLEMNILCIAQTNASTAVGRSRRLPYSFACNMLRTKIQKFAMKKTRHPSTDLHTVTYSMTIIFMITAVRTWNLKGLLVHSCPDQDRATLPNNDQRDK